MSGSCHAVARWYKQPNDNSHVVRTVVKDSFRSDSYSDWAASVVLGRKVEEVVLHPQRLESAPQPEAPVISNYTVDASEGYFRLGFVGTFAIPKDWLRILPSSPSVGLKVAFLLDTKWANGTYSYPEDVKINLYGFGEVQQYTTDAFKQIKDLWGGAFAIMGLATPDEVYPLPHITIDFKIEVVGVPMGTAVLQDWDALINWSYFGWNARARMEPLERLEDSPVSATSPELLSLGSDWTGVSDGEI